MSGSYDFERSWRGALGGDGFFRELAGALNISAARIVTTNASVSSSTTPALTDGTPPYLNWAAAGATTVTAGWNWTVPDDYAETKMGDGSTDSDEVRVMLLMHSLTGGSNAGIFTPTISYRRGGAAAASAIALTAYRVGSDLQALVAETNNFATATSFTLTDNPTNPQWVELQFKGGGLRAFDAAHFLLTPQNANNHAVRLYTAMLRPKRQPATNWRQLRAPGGIG